MRLQHNFKTLFGKEILLEAAFSTRIYCTALKPNLKVWLLDVFAATETAGAAESLHQRVPYSQQKGALAIQIQYALEESCISVRTAYVYSNI